MAEGFRAGLQAVSKVQIDSAKSVGLSSFQVFRYVTLPQALALSIQPLLQIAYSSLKKVQS